ncbi:uncharacterized protein LOC121375526 [Gigantopelta aegis]|uniref:uncharacterized protein LOC121375526 n=1 Tax=Gigantopelta aegis TaxID=1735272 RepID=UPI001B8877AA|nr:uncharacterized protein LOC121375526 [Gigantopelta aegis]
MKSLEALCAEYIGEYANLYPDDVFEEQTFPVLHQLVKYLQADDLNRLEPILLRHGIDVDLAWKRLCSLRWNNMLGTMQPNSLDVFQHRIYPDFKTFYYSRQFLLNLSACVRNFKYGSVRHIPPDHLDVLAFHSQQEQWILRNIAAGRFVTGESPTELAADLYTTAAYCTTITLQGSELEYINTNDKLIELFITHLKHLTIQTISLASFPHICTFLQVIIRRGRLQQVALKNILVSEESLTELVCLVCGAVGRPHNSAGCNVDLSLIDSYKTSEETKDTSSSVNGSRCDHVKSNTDFSQAQGSNSDNKDKLGNSDRGKRRKSLDVVQENQLFSTDCEEIQSSSTGVVNETEPLSTEVCELWPSSTDHEIHPSSIDDESQHSSIDDEIQLSSTETHEVQSSAEVHEIQPCSAVSTDSAPASNQGGGSLSGQDVTRGETIQSSLRRRQTGHSNSKFVRLQGCESERLRVETGDFDLFDEAVLMQRRPVNSSLMSSAPCVYPEVPNRGVFNQSDATLQCQCSLFQRVTCIHRMACDTELEAFVLNATHRLDVGHMLAQVLPGWRSLRKLALVSVMDVWSKAFECILELITRHQLTHLVLDMADIGIDGFSRLLQVLALAYSIRNCGSTSAESPEVEPLQQLLMNMTRPIEEVSLSISTNICAVVSLDLGSNTFSQQAFDSVLLFISKDTALRVVNFAYCGLTGRQLIDLLHTLIKRGSESLDELYLDDNNRDGVVCNIDEAVSQLVSSIKSLKVLSLSRCSLPGSLLDGSSFTSAVISHPSLHTVILGNNRFGLSLLPFLEKILLSQSTIKKLHIGYNYLRGEDLKHFVDRLLETDPNPVPALQELDISGNNVGVLSAFEWDSLKVKFGRFACDINATYIGIQHHFDDYVAVM